MPCIAGRRGTTTHAAQDISPTVMVRAPSHPPGAEIRHDDGVVRPDRSPGMRPSSPPALPSHDRYPVFARCVFQAASRTDHPALMRVAPGGGALQHASRSPSPPTLHRGQREVHAPGVWTPNRAQKRRASSWYVRPSLWPCTGPSSTSKTEARPVFPSPRGFGLAAPFVVPRASQMVAVIGHLRRTNR